MVDSDSPKCQIQIPPKVQISQKVHLKSEIGRLGPIVRVGGGCAGTSTSASTPPGAPAATRKRTLQPPTHARNQKVVDRSQTVCGNGIVS